MYNKGMILGGIIVFLAVFTFPLWSNVGGAIGAPKPQLPAEEKATQCVLPTDEMRSSHMQLLNQWRDSVVREGNRIYVTEDGRQFMMSLQNNCMECHQSKTKFCDECHNYVGVAPYCWECHIEPKEAK